MGNFNPHESENLPLIAKNMLAALWGALALALLETLLCIIAEVALYLIQSKLPGIGFTVAAYPIQSIWFDNKVILMMRVCLGFVPVMAIVLYVFHFWPHSFHWAVLGLVNVAIMLLMCAACEPFFPGLLGTLLQFDSALYRNEPQILVVACLFSPWMLSKWPLGTILPYLLSGEKNRGK